MMKKKKKNNPHVNSIFVCCAEDVQEKEGDRRMSVHI